MIMRSTLRNALAVATLWLAIGLNAAHAQSIGEALQYLDAERFQPEVYLPYQADAARSEQLITHMNMLALGQSTEEVRGLLGAPDEIEAVFKVGDRTEELEGFKYVYLFSREKSDEWGQAYNEKFLHLSFNLHGRLEGAEGFMVKGFHELVRELGLGFEFSMGLHETVKIDELFIHLDFILDAEAPASCESAGDREGAAGSYALFTLTLPDRKDNFKLAMDSPAKRGEQSKNYNKYKISLRAIPNSERVAIIVE
jgi:hypothetical protein